MRLISYLTAVCCLSPGTFAFAENSSEDARKNLTWQAEVHAGFNGAGAGVGVFLPGDNRVDLSYSEISLSLLGTTAELHNYKLEFQSFVGNSFYYSLGVTHSDFRLTQDEIYFNASSITYGRNVMTSSAKSNLVHVTIGNEWQWDHFFIGAEWIGGAKVVSWSYTNSYADGTDEAMRKSWEQDTEEIAKANEYTLLNLFLGFSF